ncbi:retrovirus-related Pol polyprotein from transposon 297 [Trichonephila clavipes]|nr:retrovirus-related Pol polyprotein from transposon 297 [Trichonephila clavipes]
MPFGLCNAPATFERLMEALLGGLSYEACLVYVDGIIIVGRSFEEHLKISDVFYKSFLAYPEIGKQFILDTDASPESIGAVLSQEIDV